MNTSRRRFLQSTAGAAGALAATAAGTRPTWQEEFKASTLQSSTVRVLGPEPTTPIQKLVRSLSDDVFERLCQTFKGRSCQLFEHQRLGIMGPRGKVLNLQAHTAIGLSSEFTSEDPPWFDISSFRLATNCWMKGPALLINWVNGRQLVDLKDNREDVFAGITFMGMPYFPTGVEWAAHYVDERTGVFMRALGCYDLNTDQVIGRWDVICG